MILYLIKNKHWKWILYRCWAEYTFRKAWLYASWGGNQNIRWSCQSCTLWPKFQTTHASTKLIIIHKLKSRIQPIKMRNEPTKSELDIVLVNWITFNWTLHNSINDNISEYTWKHRIWTKHIYSQLVTDQTPIRTSPT